MVLFLRLEVMLLKVRKRYLFKRLSLKQGTWNWGMGDRERGTGNGERGTGNGESLKAGIFKMGNL